jgi:hypothetical protein
MIGALLNRESLNSLLSLFRKDDENDRLGKIRASKNPLRSRSR